MKKKQQKKSRVSKRKNYVTSSAVASKRLGYGYIPGRDYNLELQIAETFNSFDFNSLVEGLTAFKFNFDVYNSVHIEFLDIRVQMTMEQLRDWAFNDKIEDTITT